MNCPQIEYVADFQMRGSEPMGQALSMSAPFLAINPYGMPWFALSCQPAGSSQQLDWDSVHEAIQEHLERLTRLVLVQSPQTVWKSGRNSARAFPLLSYRVFYRSDGDDYDPVTVGITVTLEGSLAQVSGDISGDESGHVYFDEGCDIEVSPDQDDILEAASLVASRIADQAQIVVDAVSDRNYQVA